MERGTGRAIELPELETFDILDGKFQYTCSKNDGELTEGIRKDGMWEPAVTRVWREIVERGMRVIDIGANWGYYTLISADIVGDSHPVIAFEPHPVSRRILQLNLKQNNIGNVVVMPCALSDFSGVAPLHFHLTGLGSPTIESHHLYPESQLVSVYPLDDICHDEVDLVKIDAEGSDFKILEGMRKTIERSPKIKILCEFLPSFHAHPENAFYVIESLHLRCQYVTPDGEIADRPQEWLLNQGCATLYLTHQ